MAGLSLKTLCICASALTFLGLAHAHGESKGHQQPIKVDPNAPWAVRHMQEEHHISYFDPGAFFSFHDFDDNGFWDGAEIQKFYGLDDPSAKDVSYEKRHEVVDKIMELMDKNDDGMVSHDEWMRFSDGGSQLPDFGLGPGHHWDMETEYEIHHWERYHDENTKEEDLTHPEDIEHFKLHDKLEEEEEEQRKLDAMAIVEHNIPNKFKRHS